MVPALVLNLRVRYAECDAQGVVFNPNYLAYYDIAMTELLRASGLDYHGMVEGGVDMVAAESSLRFLGPARFDDELELEIGVTRLGATALGTHLRITNGGEPVVDADMRYVFIEAATKAKHPIPEHVRTALSRFAVEG